MKLDSNSDGQQFENSDIYIDFCNLLPEVCHLLSQENYDESLNLINSFYFNNAQRDQSNQLKFECDKWIASIFEEAERYEESLQILKRIYKDVKPDDVMFISYQTDIVRILTKMHRFEDAISESQIALDKQIDGDVLDLFTLLFYYAHSLQLCSKKFPDKYFSFTVKVLNDLSSRLLDLDLVDSESLCKAILETYDQHCIANKRYSRLLISLDEAESKSHKISLLNSYIGTEDFDFYKNLALEELHDLEDTSS